MEPKVLRMPAGGSVGETAVEPQVSLAAAIATAGRPVGDMARALARASAIAARAGADNDVAMLQGLSLEALALQDAAAKASSTMLILARALRGRARPEVWQTAGVALTRLVESVLGLTAGFVAMLMTISMRFERFLPAGPGARPRPVEAERAFEAVYSIAICADAASCVAAAAAAPLFLRLPPQTHTSVVVVRSATAAACTFLGLRAPPIKFIGQVLEEYGGSEMAGVALALGLVQTVFAERDAAHAHVAAALRPFEG